MGDLKDRLRRPWREDVVKPDAQEEFGVEAIVYLQSMAGITEPPDRARAAWRSLTESERETTVNTYFVVTGRTRPDAS